METECKEVNIKIQCGCGSAGGTNPVGSVISVMGLHAPEGYLALDGTQYNINDYTELAGYFETELVSSRTVVSPILWFVTVCTWIFIPWASHSKLSPSSGTRPMISHKKPL